MSLASSPSAALLNSQQVQQDPLHATTIQIASYIIIEIIIIIVIIIIVIIMIVPFKGD